MAAFLEGFNKKRQQARSMCGWMKKQGCEAITQDAAGYREMK
jgi:hypothetical protein